MNYNFKKVEFDLKMFVFNTSFFTRNIKTKLRPISLKTFNARNTRNHHKIGPTRAHSRELPVNSSASRASDATATATASKSA